MGKSPFDSDRCKGVVVNPLVRVSEAASIGLHGMMLLARQPSRSLSVKDLAEALPVSSAHLAKVLQRLARMGLLLSARGPRGGFRLARAPSEYTLLQIYEAIDGPLLPGGCLMDRPVCTGTECLFGDVLVRATREVRERLAQTRLSDFVPPSGG